MRRLILGIMVGCALLLAAPVWAGPISDSFTVFDANGNIAYQASVSETFEDPTQIYYINVIGIADPNQFGNATTLCEGTSYCDQFGGNYSDIFGVAIEPDGNFYLAFNSDSENAPAAYGSQGNIFMPEGSGGNFDATMYLDPSLQAQGYTAQFFSDGDPAPIPEPGTITLLGTGLVGAIGALRKRLA